MKSFSLLKTGPALILFAALTMTTGSRAEEEVKAPEQAPSKPTLAAVTEASLIFRQLSPTEEKGDSRTLQVFIQVKNLRNGPIDWPASATMNVEAELLDPEGKPAAAAPQSMSLSSGSETIHLPYGSSIDWLVSHGGISLAGNRTPSYVLRVGGRGWLIPMVDAPRYTLHLKVVKKMVAGRTGGEEVFIDVPAAKVEVTSE